MRKQALWSWGLRQETRISSFLVSLISPSLIPAGAANFTAAINSFRSFLSWTGRLDPKMTVKRLSPGSEVSVAFIRRLVTGAADFSGELGDRNLLIPCIVGGLFVMGGIGWAVRSVLVFLVLEEIRKNSAFCEARFEENVKGDLFEPSLSTGFSFVIPMYFRISAI